LYVLPRAVGEMSRSRSRRASRSVFFRFLRGFNDKNLDLRFTRLEFQSELLLKCFCERRNWIRGSGRRVWLRGRCQRPTVGKRSRHAIRPELQFEIVQLVEIRLINDGTTRIQA